MQASDANRRRVDLAGVLLVIGAVWFILSVSVAESLTPGYNVSTEAISGLGSPILSGICNDVPWCVTLAQPASAIFVFALFLDGISALWCGMTLWSATNHGRFGLGVSTTGVAAILVGASYLPFYLGGTSTSVVEAVYAVHVTGALLSFILTPIVSIFAYRIIRTPLRYLSPALGVFALAACLLYLTGNFFGMGAGGMERMVVYPMTLWGIGFGAYMTRGLD